MAVNLIEAIYLMKELGIETVSVDALINVFLKPATEAATPAAEQAQPALPDLPELPEPPKPPTYPDYKAAKKAAKKGQTPVKEGDEYILL